MYLVRTHLAPDGVHLLAITLLEALDCFNLLAITLLEAPDGVHLLAMASSEVSEMTVQLFATAMEMPSQASEVTTNLANNPPALHYTTIIALLGHRVNLEIFTIIMKKYCCTFKLTFLQYQL